MKKFDQINIIPFIDIMLVLLSIVLMTAAFISQGKIKVKLPSSPAVSQQNRVGSEKIITINAAGHLFYNDKATTIDVLERLLANTNSHDSIVMRVDARVAFQHFVVVTGLLKKYGLSKVSVVTKSGER